MTAAIKWHDDILLTFATAFKQRERERE